MTGPILTRDPLALTPLIEQLASVEDGAIATFLGTARRHSDGKEVVELRYEAYWEMAENVIEEILSEVPRRFPGARAVARHRVGLCPLGEASVAVVAASAHRKEAFAACRFVIDTLKQKAPIWKQEVYADGTRWIGDPEHPCSHSHD